MQLFKPRWRWNTLAMIFSRMMPKFLPYSGKNLAGIKSGKMAKIGCILILAKFKFGNLELYLWRNRSAFSTWRTLARQNWEWRLLRSTAVFKATMFSKVFGTQPQGKNWTVCKKGQTPRILTLWLRYVEVLLLAMSPERCQPLVRYSWDEGGSSDMINFD